MPGEIDSYQAQIEGLKKSAKSPDKLKAALGSGVLTGAVDEGQALLKKVAGELKSTEAKAYLSTARNQLIADLSYIAGQGQSILAGAKRKKGIAAGGEMTLEGKTVKGEEPAAPAEAVEPNVEGITQTIAALQSKLTAQKEKIGEYKKYEEKEKKADEYIKSVKEGRKLYDEYTKKDIENMKLKKEGKEPIPLDDLRQQIIAAGQKIEADSKIKDTMKSSDPGINAMFDDLKGKMIQETDSAWLFRKSDIESMEKEQGSQDAYQKVDALKEMNLKFEVEMQKYISLADSINANWEKADAVKKTEFKSLEQGLLQGYAVAKGIIGEVQADVDAGKINWPDGMTKVGEKIAGNISKIESYKIQRIVNKRLKENKYDQYYQFGENKDGNMTYGGTDKLKIGKWKLKDEPKRNAIIISCKGFLMDARAQVRAETKQAEVKGLVSQGKKGMDRLKQKLGGKGSKYFEAMKKMAAGDREGALKLLGEYGAQKFTKEDLETHAGVMKEAQSMYDTMSYSKSYYSALSTLKGGDQKQSVGMFKAYIAEVKKLPKEQQALHANQLSIARETIQRIGMDGVEKMENLFGDVRKLRDAKRKLAGAHLHYSESMEDEYMTAELAVLRAKVAKGDADIDVFKEIEAARKRVKAKVQKKLDDPKVKGKYEPSLLDEASDLFKAMYDKHPNVRKKALVEFAKKCRKEKAYGMAKRYLEHAMEENYKWYAKKVDKDKIRDRMSKDPKIVKWVTENARVQYARMKAKGSSMGLTFDQVRNQLMKRKLGQAYRAEMRKAMTLDGLAGKDYQESAKSEGATWGDFHIVTGNSEWVTHRAGGADEALILYNEYFKEGEKDKFWGFDYNPTQWGAEDWDEFEDDSIKFAFETLCTFGIGAGSAAMGRKAGSVVLKRLATKGLSKAAIETIKEGGKTALKAAVKKQRKGILKAYLAYHAAGIAAEGATMFALGTIQSGMMDPKGTAEQFSSAWSGPLAIGEAMAKAAIYRMMGGVGQSLLGKNPGLLARGLEHFASGVAGEGVEYGALVLKGQAGNYTMRDFVKGMVQDSFQAAGRGLTSGRFKGTMPKGELRARRAAMDYDFNKLGISKPEDIGKLQTRKITFSDGSEGIEYIIRTKKGVKILAEADIHAMKKPFKAKINDLVAKAAAKAEPPKPKAKPKKKPKAEGGPYRTPGKVDAEAPGKPKKRLKKKVKPVAEVPEIKVREATAKERAEVLKAAERKSEQYPEIVGTKVEKILSAEKFSSEQLVDALKKSPELKKLFEADAGVKDNITIEQHVGRVMGQFEKYFANKKLPGGVDKKFLRLFIALHDIGKPRAMEKGSKELQHEETVPIIKDVLKRLGYDDAKIQLMVTLVDSDPIGDVIRKKSTPEKAGMEIEAMAKKANMSPKDFLALIEVFYMSDASSYTTDAGGSGSLNKVFHFDSSKNSIDYSNKNLKLIQSLRKQVSEIEKARKMGIITATDIGKYEKQNKAQLAKEADDFFKLPEAKRAEHFEKLLAKDKIKALALGAHIQDRYAQINKGTEKVSNLDNIEKYRKNKKAIRETLSRIEQIRKSKDKNYQYAKMSYLYNENPALYVAAMERLTYDISPEKSRQNRDKKIAEIVKGYKPGAETEALNKLAMRIQKDLVPQMLDTHGTDINAIFHIIGDGGMDTAHQRVRDGKANKSPSGDDLKLAGSLSVFSYLGSFWEVNAKDTLITFNKKYVESKGSDESYYLTEDFVIKPSKNIDPAKEAVRMSFDEKLKDVMKRQDMKQYLAYKMADYMYKMAQENGVKIRDIPKMKLTNGFIAYLKAHSDISKLPGTKLGGRPEGHLKFGVPIEMMKIRVPKQKVSDLLAAAEKNMRDFLKKRKIKIEDAGEQVPKLDPYDRREYGLYKSLAERYRKAVQENPNITLRGLLVQHVQKTVSALEASVKANPDDLRAKRTLEKLKKFKPEQITEYEKGGLNADRDYKRKEYVESVLGIKMSDQVKLDEYGKLNVMESDGKVAVHHRDQDYITKLREYLVSEKGVKPTDINVEGNRLVVANKPKVTQWARDFLPIYLAKAKKGPKKTPKKKVEQKIVIDKKKIPAVMNLLKGANIQGKNLNGARTLIFEKGAGAIPELRTKYGLSDEGAKSLEALLQKT